MGNTIPNKVDGTLKFETEIAEGSLDKVGKHPIIAKDVTTTDIASSDVVKDWEDRNDKAVTVRRSDIQVTFDITADYDLLGKVVGDLQDDDMGMSGENMLGTLKYVDDYTGFSGDPEDQVGNFVAFKVAFAGEYDNITLQKGDSDEVDYDPNDFTFVLVMHEHYPIILRAYKDGKVVATKTINTNQLVFEPAENS